MIFFDKECNYFVTRIALLIWSRGVYRIIDQYIEDSIYNNILMIILAIAILYNNTGSLSIFC